MLCSGHGTFIETTSMCVCDDGWGSRGDFSPNDGSDCDQNLQAIRGLGIMLMFLSIIVIPIKARFSYLRYINPMPQKTVQQVQVMYGVTNVFYEISIFLYGLLKCVDPMKYVIGDMNGDGGMDIILLFTTIFFFLLLYCASLNLSYFLEGTMKVMSIPPDRQNRIKGLIYFIQKFGWIFSLISALISFLPFFCLRFPSHTLAINQSFQILYYIIMTSQGSILIFLLTLVLGETGEFISTHPEPSDTLTKISAVHGNLTFQCRLTSFRVFISISWLVFSTWPFLRRKFTYYYCIYYLFTYFSGLISFKALWNFKPKQSNKVSPVKYEVQMVKQEKDVEAASNTALAPTEAKPES